ncbi:hypothetical protein V8C37DRAFT_372435 [Trichoderma ceciliae]
MESMQQQQQPQPQQKQNLAGQEFSSYPQRPLSPITEEAVAELARNKKRSRESSFTACEGSDVDRDLKRRQTLDSRGAVEAAAGDETEGMKVTNEDVITREASYEEASTQAASPRENLYGKACHGEADEEMSRGRSFYEKKSNWSSPLSGYDQEPSVSPNYESGSDCYALPKIMWPKEHKSAPYRDPSWSVGFKRFGIFICEFPEGLTEESGGLCKELFEREQSPPKRSLFDDEVIGETCIRAHYRNETMIFRDITPLIAPSAEILASRGEEHLGILCESTNEIWTYSQPVLRAQPQPSYSVGFKAQAFTEEQFTKVTEFFEPRCSTETSPIMGTSYMFFPCFSCEIGSLEIAQRQNAHNMTIGMRAVVELFRGVNREAEVHRQILAFSISHNHHQVQIVAHYPVILGEVTEYYQQVIGSFDFTDPECSDKWSAYRFTRNLYDIWMPAQFSLLCSAINDLPLDWSSESSSSEREVDQD